MSIVFLDIDGVLNNIPSLWRNIHLLPEKVRMVSALLGMTEADLVISSAWRGDPNLGTMLTRAGLSKRPVGITPSKLSATRGQEIDMYLRNYDIVGTNYVILDDEIDDIHQHNVIHVSEKTGLTWEDVRKAATILGVEMYLYLVYTDDMPGYPFFVYSKENDLTYGRVVGVDFQDFGVAYVVNLMTGETLEEGK